MLSSDIKHSIRRITLKPDYDDLWNVDDNVDDGDCDQTSADVQVCLRIDSLNGWIDEIRGTDRRHTALCIHLDQKGRHSHLTDRNGEVEEEDRDPGEAKEVVHLARFNQDLDVVSEAVENG